MLRKLHKNYIDNNPSTRTKKSCRELNVTGEENLTKIPENPPEKEVPDKMREVDLTTKS
jgi:hypothetical protein